MRTREEIKEAAREALSQQRGTGILIMLTLVAVSIVSTIIDLVISFSVGEGILYWVVSIAGTFVIYVVSVNVVGEYIKIYKGETASPGAVISEMGVNFGRKLGGMLLMSLYISLWSLLFIIPGIIKSFAYFFTPNILAEHPNVSASQAIDISKRITHGHKMEIFVFCFSFIGWLLLSILTLGILAVVYVGPYFYTADAGLYLELKEKALAEGIISPEELGMETADEFAAYN